MTRAQTVLLQTTAEILEQPSSGNWYEDRETTAFALSNWIKILAWIRPHTAIFTSVSSMVDPWHVDIKKEIRTIGSGVQPLTISDLGWTREQARDVRARLATFAADWDDPSMDIYNEP